MIRSLLYLTMSFFDISFSVEAYARYQGNPKELHLIFVNRIIRHISGTLDYGLWYHFDSSLVIVGYSDVDQARNVENRKNTFGVFIFIFIFIVDYFMAWLSKKQNLISLSIVEAKYVVVHNSCG